MFEAKDDPQKVDSVLKEKYGYGLYYFAHCLADLLYHEYLIVDSRFLAGGFKLSDKFFKDYINTLKKRRDDFIKCLNTVEGFFQAYRFGYIFPIEYEEPSELKKGQVDSVKNLFKLETCFKKIDKYIDDLSKMKEATFGKKGREIRARNLNALIWSYVMKKSDTKGIDWEGMADLFDWFLFNLKGTYYGDRLLPHSGEEIFDAFNLKRVVLRLRANLKKSDILKHRVETLKEYHFSTKDFEKMSTIEFTKEIDVTDGTPPIGGEQPTGYYHKYFLIIFPNGKTHPRDLPK